MKKAVFSNGHEALYKGRRNVKVAWMVILPDGEIIHGFSLDMEKAEKTSKNNALLALPNSSLHGFGGWGISRAAREKEARRLGFSSFAEWKRHNREKQANWLKNCKFEYVEI